MKKVSEKQNPLRKVLIWVWSILGAALLIWLLSLIPGRIAILGAGSVDAPLPTATMGLVDPAKPATSEVIELPASTQILPSPMPLGDLPVKWERISPLSTLPPVNITTMAGDPKDPSLLYAGTMGAGIYISRDSGQTWTASNSGLGKGTIGQIVINPQESAVIYVSLLEQGGVYRSMDGGQSWQAAQNGIHLEISWPHTGLLAIAPSDPNVLFFTATTGGVYRSQNGGQSWALRSERCPPATGILIDPSNPDHLIVPSYDDNIAECPAGIYTSRDGGTTWDRLTTNEMTVREVGDWWQLAAGSGDLQTMYSLGAGGTFLTLNGGASWKKIAERCDWIAANPISGAVFCKREGQVWISRDHGATWDKSSLLDDWSGRGSPPMIFESSPQAIYLGGYTIQKSVDEGESWGVVGRLGVPRMHLAIDPTNMKRIFLTMLDKPTQILRSENEGATWQVVLENLDSGGHVMIDAQGYLFFPNSGGPNSGFYRSMNSGDTWERTKLDDLGMNLKEVLVDPKNPEHIWGAGNCGSGLVTSFDGGSTFEKLEDGPNGLCEPILLSDSSGKLLYILQWGPTYRTKDGGMVWEELSSPGGIIMSAAINPNQPEILYIGSTHKGVLKSIDGGETWMEMNRGLPSLAINDIVIDPSNSEIISIASDAGVFISTNGGTNWQNFNDGLEENPIVYSLELDPQNSSLMYAVTPNGIFRIDRK